MWQLANDLGSVGAADSIHASVCGEILSPRRPRFQSYVCVCAREGGGLLMCVRGAEEPEGAVESGGEKIGAKMASWLADLCVDRGHRSD